MNFTEHISYKKGQVGEQILDKLVRESAKFIPYMPVFDGGHPFDRLLASPDKTTLQILEVKTLSARKFYPDTGISINHFHQYKHIQERYNLPVFIAFVDAILKEIYGNTLDNLSKQASVIHRGKMLNYPITSYNHSAIGKKIIYFPLANMVRELYILSDKQAQEIEQFSNYGYKFS